VSNNHRLSRRTFAKASAAAALGVATLPRLAAARESSTPLPSTWQKQGLVIGPELVPEGVWLQNFTSPAVPLEDDRWRLWCSRSGKKSPKNVGFVEGMVDDPVSWQFTWAELTAGEPIDDAPLSIGNLPAGWQPIQVVRVPLGEGRERLYFWAHGPGVVRYLAADSDDGRRFRVVDPLRPCLYHPADRAVNGPITRLKRFARRQAMPEPGEPLAEFEQICNDATNVYRLPDGTFEMYTVSLVEVPKESPAYIAYDNIAGCQRVIHRLTSDDGLRWTARRPVIVPDKLDPDDQQFYYLSVTHTPEGRYGLLGHYRCAAQTIDLEYCFSADGLKWERPLRKPLIERGAAPSLDGYLLHAPHASVRRAGKWHLFYTGNNFKHNHSESFGPEQRGIFLATTDELWSPAAANRS
jgi:hypothetical protein